MTSKYQRRKKMTGRGGEQGRSTDETPPGRVTTTQPDIPAISPEDVCKERVEVGVDLFSQAMKALCERSPFDIEEGSSGTTAVTNLPSGLVSFLAKYTDTRKRHKKAHPGGDAKLSKPGKRSSIWVETEGIFRELTARDIETLAEQSTFRSLAAQTCFSIPVLGSSSVVHRQCSHAAEGPCLQNGVAVDDVDKDDIDGQLMNIDNVRTGETHHEETGCAPLQSVEPSCSLEWILGSKERFLLTSERPSKKRKLLGSNAGLEKLLVVSPCDGNLALCHFCCQGDTVGTSNRLIVCSACKVSVHVKCYGMQEDLAGDSWMCSWCKYMNETNSTEKVSSTDRPCVFCPKSGGVLKVTDKTEVVEFAHLFCSLWMPEVYVENTSVMEPVMNVDGIKETRKKLICNICKVKYGACVRCSNGACRTSFHPICAREAGHRLEVWGKFGSNNIELRVFCSKHSGSKGSKTQLMEEVSQADANSSCITSQLPVTLSGNKFHKLKIGRKNGDKLSLLSGSTNSNSESSGDCDLHSSSMHSRSSDSQKPENGEANKLLNTANLERTTTEDINHSTAQNFIPALKKMIDGGKVNVKDLALDIGMSTDSFAAALADNQFVPEVQNKIVDWLQKHVCSPKISLKLKIKSKSLSGAEVEAAEDKTSVALDPEIKDHVSVTSVPPRRRTTSNIRINSDEKTRSLSKKRCDENSMLKNEVEVDQNVLETSNISVDAFLTGTKRKKVESIGCEDILGSHSAKLEENSAKPSECSLAEVTQTEVVCIPEQRVLLDGEKAYPTCSVIDPYSSSLMKVEGVTDFYIHPSINMKLMQMETGVPLEDINYEFDGLANKGNCQIDVTGPDVLRKNDGVDMERFAKARNKDILDLSPKDEVEGELIYFQHKLLQSAVSKKRISDDLMNKVSKILPEEIDTQRTQRWDSIFCNQYLYELRAAKKQGRKERRHKEAQAVLAAATAAAASSSRISSVRKDGLDDSPLAESRLKVKFSGGRPAIHSQPMSRPKETVARAISRLSLEKHSDNAQFSSDIFKEHARSCDICRRFATPLNPVVVCSSCKVAVHLDCYRGVKDVTGPWHCELCEDLLSSSGSRAPVVNSWEKPTIFAECGICGGTTGAFRKSTDGEWIHAFCAEWALESNFRRGQVNSIEGMDTAVKEVYSCCVCHHKKGICIKCNDGYCKNTFHPTCARSAGFYMNITTDGGKLNHKAYCEKHSVEHRNKVDSQKHGSEELKTVKEMRVNLERLRLLCERIVKREKLKRELVLCSHDILASKRNDVALSTLVRSPFLPPDVSSESATTSLKEHTDDYKSCSEAIQRSDDITVDSTVSGKRCPKPPSAIENDRKTEDSSTSHQIYTRKSAERLPFSGKQIPQRVSAAPKNHPDHGEAKSKFRKQAETFEKELVMTSDQASMKNQRLPKGFVYVPIGRLPKDEQTNDGGRSSEEMDGDG